MLGAQGACAAKGLRPQTREFDQTLFSAVRRALPQAGIVAHGLAEPRKRVALTERRSVGIVSLYVVF